jgi:hypothetical protein
MSLAAPNFHPFGFDHHTGRITKITHSVAEFFGSFQRAIAARDEFERLNGQTDAQLAALGLRREDISQHVLKTLANG